MWWYIARYYLKISTFPWRGGGKIYLRTEIEWIIDPIIFNRTNEMIEFIHYNRLLKMDLKELLFFLLFNFNSRKQIINLRDQKVYRKVFMHF